MEAATQRCTITNVGRQFCLSSEAILAKFISGALVRRNVKSDLEWKQKLIMGIIRCEGSSEHPKLIR